jgi:predicted DNA-binding transcriptional regulator AlpA
MSRATQEAAALKAVKPSGGVRLLTKRDVMVRVGVTFPTIWKWMRAGTFPRSRRLGSGKGAKVVWYESEIDAWATTLPIQPLKGDDEGKAA